MSKPEVIKMTQLEYLNIEAILRTEHNLKAGEELLEAMDASEWRLHPVYGCIHKDVFQAMNVSAEIEHPGRYDLEMYNSVLDKWQEGCKEQTFQTRSDYW